jgi:tryptophanyl-tRNA synthetase
MERMLSGLKPTGDLTLGNYIGAIKEFIKYQDEYEMYIFIADLHALTTQQDKLVLRKRIKDFVAFYIACGLDPEKVNIFIQSEIPQHAELGYILECHTHIGELNRMTQFKDKAQKGGTDGLTASLYTYPSLMAGDILMYDADHVPVGDDQKQHLELTKIIANRFNNRHGETFKVPNALIKKQGARIMDLQEPTKKMSKSDVSDKGYILLGDDLARIKNKIKSAVTDNDAKVYYDKENKPGISNLLTIYAELSDYSIEELESKYKDSGYGDFKKDLAEVVVEHLRPIQAHYNELIKSDYLNEVLDAGYEKASKLAFKKMRKVKNKLGLGRKR